MGKSRALTRPGPHPARPGATVVWLLLAVALLTVPLSDLHAQTEVKLLSNSAEPITDFVWGRTQTMVQAFAAHVAQRFTTGGHPKGYRIKRIYVYSASSGEYELSLRHVTAGEIANSNFASFSYPGFGFLLSVDSGVVEFPASGNIDLQPNTTYAIVAQTSEESITFKSTTASGDGGASGWSLEDNSFERRLDGTGWSNEPEEDDSDDLGSLLPPFRVKIQGYPIRSSNATLQRLALSATQNAPIPLSSAFDPGVTAYSASVSYPISQVTLAAEATVAESRVTLPPDANAEVDGIQVDLQVGENTVTVTVAPEEPTAPSKSYTITITRAANNPATGAPVISGAARVDETLIAEKGDIADVDGIPSPFDYQWIRVDGNTESDIYGATFSTYRLVSEDHGKKVKVKLSFIDNVGVPESRTSDAYPASGVITSPPTAADNRVIVEAGADYGFTASDFNFSDADGDALSSVKIVTRLGKGTLKLGAANVRAGDTITAVRLGAGQLKYTPPPGLRGTRLESFTFKVNDGVTDSAAAYTMTIDIRRTLVGNLEQAADGIALALPDGSFMAYAQRFRTGNTTQAHELVEVKLAITVPSGTRPEVSIWYGRDEPEQKLYVLNNPTNIHSTTDAVKRFKAAKRYSLAPNTVNFWIVVERFSGTGTIGLKRTLTGNDDARRIQGWSLADEYRRKSGSGWQSSGASGAHALQVALLTMSAPLPVIRVLDLEFSDPGPDNLYTHGEELRITATLSEPANVPGTLINLPPHFCGQAGIREGNGTDRIVFGCKIKGGPHTRVYVEANRVRPGSDGDGPRLSDTSPPAENTTVPPCGASFPDEIWCGEMTVGGTTGVETGFASGEYGSLAPGQFTYDGTEYTIVKLRTDVSNSTVALNFIPDTEHAKVNQAGFRLRLGTRSYSFPADTSTGAIESWDNADPGWSVGDTVFVRLTGPATSGNQVEAPTVEVEAPTVEGAPAVSDAGRDGQWTEGETVEVTLSFSEAVEVDISGGTPSVGLGLGGATEVRSAVWLRGSGTAQLTFGYTLVTGDGDHEAMAVTPDSLALNGGTIRSIATGADAAPGHVATLVRARPPRAPESLSARFDDVPAHHDGETAFTVELHFSADPQGLSYRTVQDGLLEVEGGTVTRAARATKGSDQGWRVTIAPSGVGDVQIRLPARPCDKPDAACIGGRALVQGAGATVPGVPFTASFSGMPAAHDGTSPFELQFRLSVEPAGLNYATVQHGLFHVSGGTIGRAWRLQRGSDAGWGLRIEPAGFGGVTLTLRATTDCAVTPGVCTSGGGTLGGGLAAKIAGPPTLSVADAQTREAADAVLDFTVTLSPALSAAATVRYGTADSSASAGADYANTSGTLTFAAGETSKTVPVAVLDDGHDEGSETMTLTLSNPSPARVKLADGEATGTIDNSDPAQQAWLSRFGRTAADHALQAIGQRWQAAGQAQPRQTHLTIGGRRFDNLFQTRSASTQDASPSDPFGLLRSDILFIGDERERLDHLQAQAAQWRRKGSAAAGMAPGSGSTSPTASGMSSDAGDMRAGMGSSAASGTSASGMGSSDRGTISSGGTPGGMGAMTGGPGFTKNDFTRRGPASAGEALFSELLLSGLRNAGGAPAPKLRDIAMGSSFFYSRPTDAQNSDPDRLGQWAGWGETAATRFSGADGELSLDGEVSSATLGVDSRRGRWLGGVALSLSEGEGFYRHPTAAGGAIASTLTSINPYAHFTLSERTSVWAVLGYGAGNLTLIPGSGATGAALETELASTMAAVGGRGVLNVQSNRLGSFTLALVSDARMTHTVSNAITGLAAGAGATSRARLLLEGSGQVPLGRFGLLSPVLEAGLRFDGGDAETGAGFEIGGGLGYALGQLQVQLNARTLVAHEDAGYEEWGFSSSIEYQPGAGGQGLLLKLGSAWGMDQSGVQSMWSRETAQGLARGGPMRTGQRYRAEFGYGIKAPYRDRLWYPYLATESSDNNDQALRFGLKLSVGAKLEAGLEFGRRPGLPGEKPEHAVMLQGTLRW